MPTRCEEDWLTDQLQILLGKLTQAAGIGEQMPDYNAQPAKAAADATALADALAAKPADPDAALLAASGLLAAAYGTGDIATILAAARAGAKG